VIQQRRERPRFDDKPLNLIADWILPSAFTIMVMVVTIQLAINWLKIDLSGPANGDLNQKLDDWVTVSAFTS